MIRIKLTSVFVDDQDKALSFYTDVLGFVKKTHMRAGQFRRLTVVSPDAPDVGSSSSSPTTAISPGRTSAGCSRPGCRPPSWWQTTSKLSTNGSGSSA